jgi:hypothetical protein
MTNERRQFDLVDAASMKITYILPESGQEDTFLDRPGTNGHDQFFKSTDSHTHLSLASTFYYWESCDFVEVVP